MRNAEIAAALRELGILYELDGADRYRVLAYREAARTVAEVAAAFPGEHTYTALADRLATGTDPKAERYWQLMAIINGWPAVPTTVPAWEWFIAALRA